MHPSAAPRATSRQALSVRSSPSSPSPLRRLATCLRGWEGLICTPLNGEALRAFSECVRCPYSLPQRAVMKKASEYRQHAEECRQLASNMESGEQRDQLLQMAANWERMAEDRAQLIANHPELAVAGEEDEERARV